jgi:hypothetical protein
VAARRPPGFNRAVVQNDQKDDDKKRQLKLFWDQYRLGRSMMMSSNYYEICIDCDIDADGDRTSSRGRKMSADGTCGGSANRCHTIRGLRAGEALQVSLRAKLPTGGSTWTKWLSPHTVHIEQAVGPVQLTMTASGAAATAAPSPKVQEHAEL